MTRKWRSLAQLCNITSFICLLSVLTLLWVRSRWNNGALALIINIREYLGFEPFTIFHRAMRNQHGNKIQIQKNVLGKPNLSFKMTMTQANISFVIKILAFSGLECLHGLNQIPKYHREIPNSLYKLTNFLLLQKLFVCDSPVNSPAKFHWVLTRLANCYSNFILSYLILICLLYTCTRVAFHCFLFVSWYGTYSTYVSRYYIQNFIPWTSVSRCENENTKREILEKWKYDSLF